MKTCSKCEIEKNFSEFHKDKNSSDGYRRICKECRKIYDPAWKYNPKINANRKRRFREKYGLEGDKCVYFIKKKSDDSIFYVGQSCDAGGRRRDHFKNPKGNKRGALHMYEPSEREKLFYFEVYWYGDNDLKRKIIEKNQIRFNEHTIINIQK